MQRHHFVIQSSYVSPYGIDPSRNASGGEGELYAEKVPIEITNIINAKAVTM
jgi:hypothetical protein